jgi:suppressor of ftsI
VRPKLNIASGEKQFWRIVNASPDLYADLEVDSESMKHSMACLSHITTTTGIQKNFRDVLLAPAGRAEVIVEGPKLDGKASLRSLCVNTGADGDPNPSMVLADLDTNAKESAPTPSVEAVPYAKAIYRP